MGRNGHDLIPPDTAPSPPIEQKPGCVGFGGLAIVVIAVLFTVGSCAWFWIGKLIAAGWFR